MTPPRRQEVKVWAVFSPEGRVAPLALEWTDGRRYEFDRFVRAEQRLPPSGGLPLPRYTVLVRGQVRYLWRDGDQWFVELKA